MKLKILSILALVCSIQSFANLPSDYVAIRLPVLINSKIRLKETIQFEKGQIWSSTTDKNTGNYILRGWLERSNLSSVPENIPAGTTFTLLGGGRNTNPITAHGFAPAVGHDGGVTLFLKTEDGRACKMQIYRIDHLDDIPSAEDLEKFVNVIN